MCDRGLRRGEPEAHVDDWMDWRRAPQHVVLGVCEAHVHGRRIGVERQFSTSRSPDQHRHGHGGRACATLCALGASWATPQPGKAASVNESGASRRRRRGRRAAEMVAVRRGRRRPSLMMRPADAASDQTSGHIRRQWRLQATNACNGARRGCQFALLGDCSFRKSVQPRGRATRFGLLNGRVRRASVLGGPRPRPKCCDPGNPEPRKSSAAAIGLPKIGEFGTVLYSRKTVVAVDRGVGHG